LKMTARTSRREMSSERVGAVASHRVATPQRIPLGRCDRTTRAGAAPPPRVATSVWRPA
jgi:hypothetical protein